MTLTITILIAAALVAAYTDLQTRRIPNWLTAGMVGYGLIYHSCQTGWSGLLLSLSGLAVGLGLMLIPYLLRGLGAGDVKFLAAVGSIVGVKGVMVVFVVASALGAILASWALYRMRNAGLVIPPFRLRIAGRSDGRGLRIGGIGKGFKSEIRLGKTPLRGVLTWKDPSPRGFEKRPKSAIGTPVSIPYGIALSSGTLVLTGLWVISRGS